jgi:probable rRNA maturation factor
MKIDLIIESDDDCDLKSQELESISSGVLKKLAIKKPHASIEVFLVKDEKINEINNKFRGINQITDVLSFPQESFPGTKEEVLGTIFIAPEYAKGESVSCKTLFLHGLFHLLGYDHETNLKKWEMAEKTTGQKTL